MYETPRLIIAKNDFEKLKILVGSVYSETSELLAEELSRATVVDLEDLPSNTVSMGSIVKFLDESMQKELSVKLTYPDELNKQEDGYQKVSILAPIGAALIGLSEGQSIEWPLPSGKKKVLKVVAVYNK